MYITVADTWAHWHWDHNYMHSQSNFRQFRKPISIFV